jgi:hypothetical protein
MWMAESERAAGLPHRPAKSSMGRTFAAPDNAPLRLARRRLFGRGSPAGTPTAAAQRGLLQIVRDFCDHSNAVCADCSFPALVRGFAVSK